MPAGKPRQAMEQPPEDSVVQQDSEKKPDPNFCCDLEGSEEEQESGSGREASPPPARRANSRQGRQRAAAKPAARRGGRAARQQAAVEESSSDEQEKEEQEEEEQEESSESESEATSPPAQRSSKRGRQRAAAKPAARSGRAARQQAAVEELASDEDSEQEEESSESESEATSPPAQRSSKRGRQRAAAKPAARRSGRVARQQAAVEESSSDEKSEQEEEEEEEQPARRGAAAARQQVQRRTGSQRQVLSAAEETASEGSGATGASGRRAASRQRAGDSQGPAPSRLGRASSRLQPQQEQQAQQAEQQPEQQASVVAQKAAAGELPCSAALKHLTLAQLQAECASLGLPAKGHKADLQDRLLKWWEQQIATEQPQQQAQQRQKRGSTAGGKRKASAAEAEEEEDQQEQESDQPAAKRTRRGAHAATASKQPQQGRRRRQEQPAVPAAQTVPQQQQQEEEEEDEEEQQRGRKRRSARKPSGRQRAGTAEAEQSPAPLPRQGSPAAAAAGQQLEMSLPPEGAGAAAARPAAAAAAAAAHMSDDEEMADAEEEAGTAAAAHSRANDPAAAAAGYLRRRLTQPRSAEAATMALRPGLQEVHRSLLDSLTSTVELGHNNSLLVVGPRGSGKTLVVERAVADLAAKYNKDPKDPVVGVIRLSGQVHADERTAFRELARQLCGAFGYQFSKAASIGENIEFLRDMLARLEKCEKVALFLLDEFDGFAGKRAKQTVLYNLLDALQTSGMLAAVVGVTCRQDVMELLEKRVKSRFSHRKLDVSLPTSALPVAAQPAEGEASTTTAPEGQDGALEVLQSMLTLPPQFAGGDFAAKWNASVAAAAGSAGVKQALQRCVNVFPSLRHLANVADWALAAASSSGTLTSAALVGALERQLSQAKGMVTMISGLPILDLILLVAVQRLAQADKHDVNFEMAHHEFSKYSLVGAHVDSYSRGAAAKAYDHLLSLGLLAFVDPRSEARVGSRPYAPAYLLVTRQEVEEGLAAHHNCPQSLSEWLKKEGGLGTTAGQFYS